MYIYMNMNTYVYIYMYVYIYIYHENSLQTRVRAELERGCAHRPPWYRGTSLTRERPPPPRTMLGPYA